MADGASTQNSTMNVVCPYFVRSSCRNGAECPRSHDAAAFQPQQLPLCRYFLLGACRYEHNCWFSHGQTEHVKPPMEDEVVVVPVVRPAVSYADTLKGNPAKRRQLQETELCPFDLAGDCPFQERCGRVHGDMCELCQMPCLHPYDARQRALHIADCEQELERNMELSFAVQRSSGKTCGICLEVVVEKIPLKDRRFGILENCNHVFCLECIRRWRRVRSLEGGGEASIATRSCPTCRVPSAYVTPSQYWVDDEAKARLIQDYKHALQRKHCKYYKRGAGTCPFGGSCFYLHALPDGTKVDLPPPTQRRATNADGESEVVAHTSLWDFIERRHDVGGVADILQAYEAFVIQDPSNWGAT